MGKVIEFRRNKEMKNESEGVRLYYQCFKSQSVSEQDEIIQEIKTALYCGMLEKLTNTQILELHGYAARKRAITEFNKKIEELLEKHGNEVLKNAISN